MTISKAVTEAINAGYGDAWQHYIDGKLGLAFMRDCLLALAKGE